MNRAERYILQAAYPKANLDKVRILEMPQPTTSYSLTFLDQKTKRLTLRKFVLRGRGRIWTMRIGRSCRRKGGKDIIIIGGFRSEKIIAEGR